MDAFGDREKAFEAKFHFDEELAFKVKARRDRLLGRWVAGHVGLIGDAIESYARSIVELHLSDAREEVMLNKLLADLGKAGAALGAVDVAAEMHRLLAVARKEIETEASNGLQTVSR